jgi:hypothetical protein
MGKHRLMEYANKRSTRTEHSIKERLDWARKRWREDPQISINGRHGMHAQMMEVFGVSAHVNQLIEVHAEVERERREQEKAAKERETHFNSLGDAIRDKLKLLPPLKADAVPRADKRTADVPPPPVAAKPPAAPPAPIVIPPELAAAPIMQARAVQPPPPAKVAEGTQHGPPKRKNGAKADGTSPRDPADAKVREDYARSIARPGMTFAELRDTVAERFGWGVSHATGAIILAEVHREAGTARPHGGGLAAMPPERRRAISEKGARARWAHREEPAPPARPSRVPSAARSDDPDAQIKAAVDLLLESVPALVALHVTREPGQRPDVEFELRLVQSGRFKL